MSKDKGIYQRPDSPYWWYCYQDERGKMARGSTRVRIELDPTGAEANRVRQSLIPKTEPQLADLTDDLRWEELIQAYRKEIIGTVKDSTLEIYDCAIKDLYCAFAGRPAALRAVEVKDYINGKLAAGYAPAYINIRIALMIAAYDWAINELELNIRNPWKRKRLPVDNARTRWLTRDEADRLILATRDCPQGYYLADFVTLALHTGMRNAEMLDLTWDRVDLEACTISLGKDDQKNGKASVIPLNSAALQALRHRQTQIRHDALITKWVFVNRKGRKLEGIRHSFYKACERAGLEDVHIHDLRRTFASWLVQAGISIQTVSALVRHSDISITHKIYAHLAPDQYRDATSILAPKLVSVK